MIRFDSGASSAISYPAGFVSAIAAIPPIYNFGIKEMLEGTGSGIVRNQSVSYIAPYAFEYMFDLTGAVFPNCLEIGTSAFTTCKNLAIVSFPKCTSVGSYAFQYCSGSGFTELSLPSCITVRRNAFANCYSINSVYLPRCESIEYAAFDQCSRITSIELPLCEYVGANAFEACVNLTTVSLPVCSVISGYAFSGTKLYSLYLLSTSLVTVSTVSSVFKNSPILVSVSGVYGSIYVPSSLLTQYQTDSMWEPLSDRFVGVA